MSFLASSIASSPSDRLLKAPEVPLARAEFDFTAVNPASIIPTKEMSDLIDHVATKKIEGVHPASIPSSSMLVNDGYGELVLRVKEGRIFRPVTKAEYEMAYPIFQKYAPRLDESPKPFAKSRIAMMREDLRRIIPNIVATFIPRTLHDLLFIRAAIEQDIEREDLFAFKNPKNPTKEELNSLDIRSSHNSWIADPKGTQPGSINYKIKIHTPSDVRKHLPELLDIGYRLNIAACKKIDQLGKNIEVLTLDQIDKLVLDQIIFLKRFSTDSTLTLHFTHASYDFAPLTVFFLNFAENYLLKKRALRKIASIECQESMAGKILCYRGGVLAKDSPVKKSFFEKDTPYSISFGNGSFSGLVNDPGACAYYHMFHLWHLGKEDAYILALDPAKETSKTFHTPSFTALESLFGEGETWHYRFKSSKDERRKIEGIELEGPGFAPGMSDADKLKFIKGPLSVQQTVDKFEDLKKNAVILIHHQDEEI